MTTETLLQEAITAVKSGQKADARKILLQILAGNDRNEEAWLWLSGAVTEDEERQICLENVLALNPENDVARRGLAQLLDSDATLSVEGSQGQVVRREYPPLTTAAAILYPERQVKEWVWRDPTRSFDQNTFEFSHEQKFDDVWSGDMEICGFCAARLDFMDRRCPQCKRGLIGRYFRYPEASTHLVTFWVLLFGLSQSYLLFMLYDILAERNYIKAIWHALMWGFTSGLGVAVYWRKHWAFLTTLFLLIVIIVTGLGQYFFPPEFVARGGFAIPLFGELLRPFSSGVRNGLLAFNVLTAGLALVYALFKVGPDFDRVEVRQVAALSKRLKTGSDYHLAARRLRDAGLWAAAVLHWQRAVGQEPHQLTYYQHLGEAYAHLHFFERARDLFQSALKLSSHPETKQRFTSLIYQVNRQETELKAKKDE
jgi:hypothetical protein